MREEVEGVSASPPDLSGVRSAPSPEDGRTASRPPSSSRKRISSQRVGSPDNFMTPPEALLPLLPYIDPAWKVWEPACGTGNLVRGLSDRGIDCIGTDINGGFDFRTYAPDHFDCIVTNPPFSLKDAFLERCYSLGMPFALLMPLTALEGKKRQSLYRSRGLELLLFDHRINFETPSGQGSGSWFATAWFTHGLNIGSGLTFTKAA